MDEIGTNIKLKEQLGQGGFGSVYRCLDENNREMAVKICKNGKQGIPHIMEMSIMTTVIHPSINRALKIYSKGSKVYIFQDLAKDDMSKYVRNDKHPTTRKDPSTLRQWMISIVSALGCLHDLNIIHADLKSSNVLIFNDNDVRLSDFTVSLKVWDSESRYNHVIGTSTHRAPENFLGRDWAKSLDIWSLGITFCEIIYGELIFPYQGNFPDKKEHISERMINCFVHWCQNGPRKQECSILSNKYEFHKFTLPEKFTSDPFRINDLLLKMLRINPVDRPSINEIANNSFFTGHVKIEHMVTAPTRYPIGNRDIDYITALCVDFSLNASATNLAIDLYSKVVKDLNRYTSKGKIKGCIFIASKVVLRKSPKNMKVTQKILELERDICYYLKYCLLSL